MTGQPLVPLYFAVVIVVLSAMDSAALAYSDPSFVLPAAVRFGLFIGNIGLIALAAALNIHIGNGNGPTSPKGSS